MTVARVYYMYAKDGMADELEAGLCKLVDLVMDNLEGCRGVEVRRDKETEGRFMFVEHWDSIEAHKAGAAAFGKLNIGSIMGALDRPPEGYYFDNLAERRP